MIVTILACAEDTGTSPAEEVAPDLSERLDADDVRAGVVTDLESLFGGVAAEGAPGDLKIYNDRVRFVIQGMRDSSYYIEQGGQLIDADIVRPDGQPGRDVLDELGPMIGLARVVEPTSVRVLSDGRDGRAVVRVEGWGAPMHLATGALENPEVVQDLSLFVTTDYALEPGSWSMEVSTTVRNDGTDAFKGAIGMVGIYGLEVAERYDPRTGRGDPDEADYDWTALVGKHNEVTVALMGADGALAGSTLTTILGSLAPMLMGFSAGSTIEPGASGTWSCRLGAGPDPATLVGENLSHRGIATTPVAGTVTASGAPLAGARVHVLDAAGLPASMAITGADGAWSAALPADGSYQYLASGRGPGLVMDLPPGAAWVSPHGRDRDDALGSLRGGKQAIPFADGYGMTAAGSAVDLALVAPGTVHVTVADGGPAVVRASFAAGDPVAALDLLVPGRPGGHAAIGYVRDGDLDLALEPGTYDILVHRGARHEVFRTRVEVASGSVVDVDATLAVSYAVDGVVSIDPHCHAAPSADGGVSMEDRLLTMAANGIDVHVGTDHDHVTDYRPMLEPLGLDGVLASIVADEVSPVLRGHFNAWPATRALGRANGGAPRWWLGVESTSALFAMIRELVGADGIIQANHPTGASGMFERAGYRDGKVRDPDRWSSDFDAMEALNSGDHASYWLYYFDLVNHGKKVTPVGVSDTHGHDSGHLGASFTWLRTGTGVDGITDDVVRAAMRARATVIGTGPYIDATIAGAWAPGAEVRGPVQLDVAVKSPSWMPVETVQLWRDGAAIESRPCSGPAPARCAESWTLDPEVDASYVVIAESTASPMVYAHAGDLAWAMTSSIFVDADGDGWRSPSPAIVLGE